VGVKGENGELEHEDMINTSEKLYEISFFHSGQFVLCTDDMKNIVFCNSCLTFLIIVVQPLLMWIVLFSFLITDKKWTETQNETIVHHIQSSFQFLEAQQI